MVANMSPPPWHISVLIPACNEAELLPRCIRSVLEAASYLPGTVSSDIVVVADRSTDGTARIAADFLRSHGTVVNSQAGSTGTARALAVKCALARYSGAPERCWLANTDADCVIPPTWLMSQLILANQGIEAIAGTVSVDSFAEHGPEVPARFRDSYVIRPDGSHPHIHGANLGVRADAFLRAGGWANLRTAEDHDLWRRLLHLGGVVVSTTRTEVVTSGRRVGRAPNGFAGALAAHNASAAMTPA
jgi:glycosyltransferase involved in cell wall biosynthesis